MESLHFSSLRRAGGSVSRAPLVISIAAVSLSGSALSYAQEPVIEVTVTGEQPPAVGSRAREPLRDIPATVTVVTAREFEERGTADAPSALSWVPGLTPQLQYGAFTYMTIRGFDDFVSIVDGLRDDRSTIVSSAPTGNLVGVDRIEVLKGPASALYGYGGIGGVVSYLSKQPSREAGYEASLSLGGPTWLRRASVGATGPIGERFAFRADAGLVADEDFRGTRSENATVRGALEWRPNQRHMLVARGAFQKMHFDTDTGLPTEGGRVPDGIPLNRRFNTASDHLDAEVYDARLDYTYEPADWISLAVRAGVSHNPYTYKSAEVLAVGPSETVERQWFYLDHTWNPLSLQVEVRARGRLLVPHRALLGYEFGYLASEHPRANLAATDLAPVPFGEAPDPQGDYPVTIDKLRERWQMTHAVYAHDTLALMPGFKLSLSGRFDDFRYEESNSALDANGEVTATDTFDRGAAAFTFRSGFVLQPATWVTFYGVAGTSFRPVRVVPEDGRELDPERGRQFEIGARVDAFNKRAHVDLAGYSIRKTDIVVARGSGIYDQAGAQSSRGIEASLSLERLGGLTLRAGYAYTLARFDSYVSADGDFTGNTPPGVPDHTWNAWGTYDIAGGFSAGAGVRGVGQSWADTANTVPMPAYAIVDAALYYTRGPLGLALNAGNLFGMESYFVSTINGTQLTPGAPRTFLTTVRFRS
jgi:iron complex outermembrane receptor protein